MSIIRTVTLGLVRIIALVVIRTESDPGTRNQSTVTCSLMRGSSRNESSLHRQNTSYTAISLSVGREGEG